MPATNKHWKALFYLLLNFNFKALFLITQFETMKNNCFSRRKATPFGSIGNHEPTENESLTVKYFRKEKTTKEKIVHQFLMTRLDHYLAARSARDMWMCGDRQYMISTRTICSFSELVGRWWNCKNEAQWKFDWKTQNEYKKLVNWHN